MPMPIACAPSGPASRCGCIAGTYPRNTMSVYTDHFYLRQRDGSRRSAAAIIPLVLDLVPARSVVDVGCGVGTWLSVFIDRGVADVLGVDGGYVDRALLEIRPERFIAADLRKPLRSGRAFDLAVSLEVAEHLPAECAATFVGTHKLGSCRPVLRRDSVLGRHSSRQRAVAGLLGESVQAGGL